MINTIEELFKAARDSNRLTVTGDEIRSQGGKWASRVGPNTFAYGTGGTQYGFTGPDNVARFLGLPITYKSSDGAEWGLRQYTGPNAPRVLWEVVTAEGLALARFDTRAKALAFITS